MTSFDGIARVYRLLEYAAFGRGLQRSREAHLGQLSRCADILIMGDGDGRCLTAVMRAAPYARVHCVDDSQTMLNLADARLSRDERRRVTFERVDARAFDPGPRTFDAMITMFFLDCFVERDVRALIERLVPHLRADGVWLFTDFSIPAHGLARVHAQIVVGGLYGFFRMATGLQARDLPPSEALLAAAGLRLTATTDYRMGLIRSPVYARSSDR